MLETLGLAFGLMLFQRVTELNDGQIRFFGLLAVAGGALLFWFLS